MDQFKISNLYNLDETIAAELMGRAPVSYTHLRAHET